MEIKAYAKINLSLNVIGKRTDGYHELEMVMVPLAMHDKIMISPANEDQLTCSDETLEMDEQNTVVKALDLIRKTYNIAQCFHIHVIKRIPQQAGLAGGSSDAAAVLKGIAQCMQLHVPLEELAMLGKQIGADVPFCVMQQCAIVKGIGEKITPFLMCCDFHILIVKPQAGVPTGTAFSMLDYDACDHPNCDEVKVCLEQNRFDDLANFVSNSLEYSAFQIVPEIKDIKKELLKMHFPVVLMSGSGSSVFALSKEKQQVIRGMKYMIQKGYFACDTNILGSKYKLK